MNRIAFTLILSLASLAAMPAQAATFEFPSEKTTYSSFFGGSGTIPNGSRSSWLSWGGDNITQVITGTGLTSVTGLSNSFDIYTSLRQDTTFGVSINGVSVGSFVLPNCNCSGRRRSTSFSIDFGAVFGTGAGNGNFTVTYSLLASVPGGGGSVEFYDGGAGTLRGGTGPIPEPASWAMMIAGFGLAGQFMRRRAKPIAVRFA